jgi:hypothetical protein
MSTQTRHPLRTTLRTVFELLIALAVVVPLVLAELGYTDLIVFGVSVVAVCAAVTRVMAIPQVVAFLERFVPWLAPEPKPRDDYRLD